MIPIPFGPYEEPRFTAYLMKTWMAGGIGRVETPRYIRDHIPVSLLARAYVDFVGADIAPGAIRRLNPSFYAESVGAFAERVSREAQRRLKLPCLLEISCQREFAQPPVRINFDLLEVDRLGWNETRAWDDFVDFYQAQFLS